MTHFLKMRALLVLILVVMLSNIAACTSHVFIVQRGYAIVDNQPSDGAVHPYPKYPSFEPWPGPFMAVYFSTDSNLESLATKRTYHLFADLLPCSEEPFGDYLYSGTVYVATGEERKTMLGEVASERAPLYKALISLDFDRMLKLMNGHGGLDVPKLLDTAKRDGLCMWVGGAQMCCSSLRSNLVNVPLELRDEALVVHETLQQR